MLKRILITTISLSLLATPPVAEAKATPSCPQYEAQLRKYGLPVKQFSYIMWRESRCNPKAVSSQNGDGSYDYGALQVNSTWRTVTARICNRPYRQVKKSLLKFDCNLRVSKYLYENGGLGHWRITSGSK
jgi:hypothetical protein